MSNTAGYLCGLLSFLSRKVKVKVPRCIAYEGWRTAKNHTFIIWDLVFIVMMTVTGLY